MLAILEDSYYEESVKNLPLTRTLLRLHPLLAPYFVAIIPLNKQSREVAYQIYLNLLKSVPFNLT